MRLNKTLIENNITGLSPIGILLPNGQCQQIVADGYRWLCVKHPTPTKSIKYIYQWALENISHFHRLEQFLHDTKIMIHKPEFRLVKNEK